MNPWLIGFLVWLASLVPVWLFFAGASVAESICAQREEDEIRRIAAASELLPEDWQEIDARESWLAALAEMRRRKTGGA